jgi:hypothetical protein
MTPVLMRLMVLLHHTKLTSPSWAYPGTPNVFTHPGGNAKPCFVHDRAVWDVLLKNRLNDCDRRLGTTRNKDSMLWTHHNVLHGKTRVVTGEF